MNKTTMLTSIPDEIITKHVEKDNATKKENELSPDAVLFAMQGGNGSKGSKGLLMNKEDNNREETEQWKCIHCQRWGHMAEKWMSEQCFNPPTAANISAKATTEVSVTESLTTSTKNCNSIAARYVSRAG